MAVKKRATKAKPRKKAKVKTPSCRTAGSQMRSKNSTMRKVGAKKLGSTTCKTQAQIKKSTTKVAKISKLAKKMRKKNESWPSAMKRAAKAV